MYQQIILWTISMSLTCTSQNKWQKTIASVYCCLTQIHLMSDAFNLKHFAKTIPNSSVAATQHSIELVETLSSYVCVSACARAFGSEWLNEVFSYARCVYWIPRSGLLILIILMAIYWKRMSNQHTQHILLHFAIHHLLLDGHRTTHYQMCLCERDRFDDRQWYRKMEMTNRKWLVDASDPIVRASHTHTHTKWNKQLWWASIQFWTFFSFLLQFNNTQFIHFLFQRIIDVHGAT